MNHAIFGPGHFEILRKNLVIFRGGWGQICHTVTLLKGSKYMGRGDKYVTVSHSKYDVCVSMALWVVHKCDTVCIHGTRSSALVWCYVCIHGTMSSVVVHSLKTLRDYKRWSCLAKSRKAIPFWCSGRLSPQGSNDWSFRGNVTIFQEHSDWLKIWFLGKNG